MAKGEYEGSSQDFRPVILTGPKAYIWRGRVQVTDAAGQTPDNVEIELGYPRSDKDGYTKTRDSIWRVQQLAALGRGDLIRWARKDRHAGHPVSSPIAAAMQSET